jgi:hypothetical protein
MSAFGLLTGCVALLGVGLGGCGGAATRSNGDLGAADMLGALACGGLVDCLNAAGSDAVAQEACKARANSRAATLAQALYDCINGQCGPADAGATTQGPCGSEPECVWCVQFGTSPTGGKHASCIDVDPSTHSDPPTVSDPKCGLCVDELNSCYSDSSR